MAQIITGGKGLVGSQFNDSYIKLSRNNVDFTDRGSTIALFKKLMPETVIHTAAKVGGLYSNMQNPAGYFEQNVSINSNILQACKATGVKKMVAFLSTCIFPDAVEYPLTEDKIHLGPPHPSNYGYAYAKRMQEVAIRVHNQQYGTHYFCVVPTNIYGIYDNFSLTDGHVIPALIHKVFLARENKTGLKVPGDGSALRQFIFAKDVADIVNKLLEQYTATSPIIISSPTEISIKQLLDMIIELMHYKGRVEWQTNLPNGQHRKPGDISKLMGILPNLQFTPFFEGLRQTILWFEANYPHIRK